MMKKKYKKKVCDLKQGDHACLYSRHRKEQAALSAEFLKTGLKKGECCLFLGDPLLLSDVTTALARRGVDVQREVYKGALLLQSERGYLDDRGKFEPKSMLKFLIARMKKARKTGFKALRCSGDVIWQLGTELDLTKLIRYEKLLDDEFGGKPWTALCQYHPDHISPKYFRNMMLTHAKVVHKGALHTANPYYRSVPDFEDLDFQNLPLKKMFAALA